MARIIENTDRRLRLQVGGRGLSTCICTLDRESNVAELAHLALRIRYRRERIVFSNIRTALVKRRGRAKTYRTLLEVSGGRQISLGEYTKEEALEAAQAIRDFLRDSHQLRAVFPESAVSPETRGVDDKTACSDLGMGQSRE